MYNVPDSVNALYSDLRCFVAVKNGFRFSDCDVFLTGPSEEAGASSSTHTCGVNGRVPWLVGVEVDRQSAGRGDRIQQPVFSPHRPLWDREDYFGSTWRAVK